MGFVIWGAGERGKRLLNLLGQSRVAAFVDNFKAGEIVCGLPVIYPDEYEKEYSDCVLLVSPDHNSDIIHQIESKSWRQYLSFSECPMEVQWGYNIDAIRNYVLKELYDYKKIYLFGLSIYSLIVYGWLINERKDVALCPSLADREKKEGVIERLTDYRFEKIDDADLAKGKLLICCKEVDREILAFEEFDIYDLCRIFKETEDRLIKSFHNVYDGKVKRCFIVATGPSLKTEDLTFLFEHKEICFSMNKIFYAFDETEWRPDYYLVTDSHITTMCRKEILELEAKAKFITELDTDFWANSIADGLYKVHEVVGIGGEERFSDNVAIAFEKTSTVTFVAIQLAAYMGFKEIYLIGVDHSGGKEVNSPERHFYGNKDAYAFSMRWEPEGLLKIEKDYIDAEKYSRNHGFRIYNATRGGYLDVFERKNLDDLFKQIEEEKRRYDM